MYAVAETWPAAHSPVAGPRGWCFAVVGDLEAGRCEDLRPEWWRLGSYQLVHVGWAHAAANFTVQLLFGVPVNMVTANADQQPFLNFLQSLAPFLAPCILVLGLFCVLIDIQAWIVHEGRRRRRPLLLLRFLLF
jgi:membrane associated rhomboid family serine protease